MAQSPPEAEPYDFQFERDLLTVMGRMDEYIEFTIQIIPNELELQIGTSGDCWWKTATKRTSADEKMYLYIAGQYIRMDDSPLLRKNELKMAPIERLQTLTRRRHENFGRSFVRYLIRKPLVTMLTEWQTGQKPQCCSFILESDNSASRRRESR